MSLRSSRSGKSDAASQDSDARHHVEIHRGDLDDHPAPRKTRTSHLLNHRGCPRIASCIEHRSTPAMTPFPQFLRRTLAAATFMLALLAGAAAHADTDYTDHWSNASQNGWGVALTQGTNDIYTEIFHYNAQNSPTWFGGTMYKLTDGHYAGALYTVAGDYYGHVPYDPTAFSAVVAGTMDFNASDANHAQLSFSVNGVTVVTALTRLSLDPISAAGSYFGAFIQSLTSQCNVSGNASTDYVPAQIVISQPSLPGGTVAIEFRTVSSPSSLYYTMSGTATQYGKVLDIPVAAYASPDSSFTSLHIYDLRRTANNGIEGRWKTIGGTSDP